MERRSGRAAALWGHSHLPLLARASSKESVEYILQALWRTRRTGLDAADRAIFRDILHVASDSDLDPLLVCLRLLIRRCVNENITKDEIHTLFPQEVLPELQRLLTLLLQKFQPEWSEDVLKDQASLPRLKAMEWDLDKNQDTQERSAIISMKVVVIQFVLLCFFHEQLAFVFHSSSSVQNVASSRALAMQSENSCWHFLLNLYLKNWISQKFMGLLVMEAVFSQFCSTSDSRRERPDLLKFLSAPQLQDDSESLSGEKEVKFQVAKDSLDTVLKSMYLIRDQMLNVDATNGHEGTGHM